MKKTNCLLAGFLLIFICCFSDASKASGNKNTSIPTSVIFDTDMGNDIDDALALDMLYKYMDMGRINLLGIMINKDYRYSPEFVDMMATWYGYPDVPIGVLKHGDSLRTDDMNYTKKVSDLQINGRPAFQRTIKDYESLPKANKLYRKLLSEQPDGSVTIISVGFLTNLAQLLDTPADEYSPLTGRELIASKVKLLSVMAGSFSKEPYAEYNILIDKISAVKVFAEWPSSVVVSPFELGNAIQYPGASIENDFKWTVKHPMVEGYKAFATMPYDRPTWDLTAVLYVAKPDSTFFKKSSPGTITVDTEGYTHFVESKNGLHTYLSITPEQGMSILNYFTHLITEQPRKYKY